MAANKNEYSFRPLVKHFLTDMKSNNTETDNKFTTVKTGYARMALVLLALNFCLTGYVIVNMNKITTDLIENQSSNTSGVSK